MLLTQKEYSNLKRRLTRAENIGNPARIVTECDRAFAIFEARGYPDTWHRWNIARNDAIFALSYGEAFA